MILPILLIAFCLTTQAQCRRPRAAPKAYLDVREQARIDDVARELWQRLEEALGENSEALVALRSRGLGDNTGDGPPTADDVQANLFADPLLPF